MFKLANAMEYSLKTTLPVVFIIGLCMYAQTTPEVCPYDCNCSSNSEYDAVFCTKSIPLIIPSGTHLVAITDIANTSSIKMQYFSGTSWANVKELHLSSNVIAEIESNAFSKLFGLSHLRIDFGLLSRLDPLAFADLQNLSVLDMSGNSQLKFTELKGALSISNSLQKLQKLILVDLNRDNSAEEIDSQFFDALSDKPVTYLDLTQAHFSGIDLESFYNALGNTIEIINMSRIYLDAKKTLMYRKTTDKNLFPNLEIFDISYADISWMETIVVAHLPKFEINCFIPFLLSNQLKLNGIFESEKRLNYLIRFLGFCERQVRRRLEINSNHLVWLNVSFSPNCVTFQEVDISNNGAKYIGSNFTSHLSELVWANLSVNKLSNMEQYHEFETLFQKNIRLEWLDLSANDLSNMPRNIFQSNIKLKTLLLKNNRLHGIFFEIKHLQHLEYLDVSENLIVSFDNDVLSSFGNLISSDIKVNRSVKFSVRFMDNALLCSCETVDFVRWFVSTDVSIENRKFYTCSLNREAVLIDSNALNESEYQCEKTKIIILAVSIPLICLGTLVLAFGLSRHVCRKRRKIERIRRFIKQYRVTNPPNKYLLFLSFCSKDDDFVYQYVTNELRHRLKERVPNGENLVCIGDLEFELGKYIIEEIVKCIEASSVVIFVISKAFCESNYCEYETIVAQLERKPIILMFREEVDPRKLPKLLYKHFNQFVRVRWIPNGNSYILKPDWDKVCDSVLNLAEKSLERKASRNEMELIKRNVPDDVCEI